MGLALRARVDNLTGLDLAPAMIAKAQERGVYDALIVGDATALLASSPQAAFDLIVAADVLAYMGEVFAHRSGQLRPRSPAVVSSPFPPRPARARASRSVRRCGSPIRAPISRRPPAS